MRHCRLDAGGLFVKIMYSSLLVSVSALIRNTGVGGTSLLFMCIFFNIPCENFG